MSQRIQNTQLPAFQSNSKRFDQLLGIFKLDGLKSRWSNITALIYPLISILGSAQFLICASSEFLRCHESNLFLSIQAFTSNGLKPIRGKEEAGTGVDKSKLPLASSWTRKLDFPYPQFIEQRRQAYLVKLWQGE